jgi:hypothetical protein
MNFRKFRTKPTPDEVAKRVALQALLQSRESLAAVDIGSLSGSYGVPAPDVQTMINDERRRRGRA